MTDIAALVADHIDLWTSATIRKSGAGRGGGKRISLYGIERLRALILDLAVRGKLVPQDAGDEPATKLLADIKSAKAKYLAKYSLPKQRVLAEPTVNSPFELPASWSWSCLGEISAYIQRGKSPKYKEGSGIYVVSQRCVQWVGLDLTVAREISQESLASYEPYRFLQSNDLLWNSTGTGTIGRVIALGDVPDGIVCDSHVTLVRCPWVEARYLQSWLASDAVYGQIESLAAGSTNQIEWTAQLATAQLVPLPPLAEQRRIVAKVDELMALCDALEGESAGALAAHQALVEELLATLVKAENAADLAVQWARLESHFDTLFTTPASIDTLKQTILDLAVRGKLVEQGAGDEHSSTLLARIASKRTRLDQTNQSRKHTSNKFPFEIPNSWSWTTLGGLSRLPYGKNLPTTELKEEGYSVFGANGVIGKFSEFHYENPMLLISCRGAYSGKPNISPPRCFVTNNSIVCEFHDPALCDYRCYFYFLSGMDKSTMVSGSAQPQVTVAKAAPFPIPLPPLAEQRRIVAKVDALMALCDALKARLTDAATTQRHLADAITQRVAA